MVVYVFLHEFHIIHLIFRVKKVERLFSVPLYKQKYARARDRNADIAYYRAGYRAACVAEADFNSFARDEV